MNLQLLVKKSDILHTVYITDNQVVIAEDKDDLSYMVRKLQEAYEHRVLIINKGDLNICYLMIMKKRICF
jgi:hypothetical protein